MKPVSVEQQARQAAEDFRLDHGLGIQPLGDLAALIEQATGHDVAVLDVDQDQHGLTMRNPTTGRTFIGVARTQNPMRQRSTLAHELAHVLFNDWSEQLAERDPKETRADAFARHLLVPQDGLETFLGSLEDVTLATLSRVVQRFLVSPQIAAIAIHEAGYITRQVKADWMSTSAPRLATRFGWSDQYASLQLDSNRARAPQGLVERATRGYAEGVVTPQTIATLRGISAGQVVQELEDIGIVPRSVDTSEFEIDDLPEIHVDLTGLEDEGSPS